MRSAIVRRVQRNADEYRVGQHLAQVVHHGLLHGRVAEIAGAVGAEQADLAPHASDDFDAGNRHDELAAPIAHRGHLADDLGADVPRQDQHVVRPRLEDFFRR